jgi:type IV secretion system protein VirD4
MNAQQKKTLRFIVLFLLIGVSLSLCTGIWYTKYYLPDVVPQTEATATTAALASRLETVTANKPKKTATHPKATPVVSASSSSNPSSSTNQEQGPGSIFGSTLFITISVVAMLILGVLFFMLRGSTGLANTHGSAHFATAEELKATDSIATTPRQELKAWNEARAKGVAPESKLVIGTYNKKIIALSERQQESHVLLVAPTGKGKTSGIIIPALLGEFGSRSLFINDTKGELIGKTIGALAEHHSCFVFAPTHPNHSQYYNPLAHVHTMEDAEDFAESIVFNTGVSNEPFWNAAAKLLLTATILHLVETEQNPPLSRLADILCRASIPEVKALLITSPSALAREVATSFVNSLSLNERLTGSIMVEMATRLFPLKNPDIQRVTSANDIDFDRMIDTPTALFLSIPVSDTKRLKWLSSALIMQMMKRLVIRAEQSPDGRLLRSIAFYLDEFCNAGRIPHFTDYISLVRSMGLAFIIAIQDFGQLKREYNEDDKNTILANCTTQVVFPGCGLEENRYYSERIGETTVLSSSNSQTESGPFGLVPTQTYTQAEAQRRLMTADELRTLEPGYVLVIAGTIPPLLVWNRPYFKEPELLERANLPYRLPVHVVPMSSSPVSPPSTQTNMGNTQYFQEE